MSGEIKIKESANQVYDIIGEGHNILAQDLLYGIESTLDNAISKAKQIIHDFKFSIVEYEGFVDKAYVIKYKAKA